MVQSRRLIGNYKNLGEIPKGGKSPVEAFAFLKKSRRANFLEKVEVAVVLGIDTRKSDQVVRGVAKLPHGSGRKSRIAVFADGEEAQVAIKAGASLVGIESLEEMIRKGDFQFDVLISPPGNMTRLGKLGPILGPKGLMPNSKDGTVSADLSSAVQSVKSGQVKIRTDAGAVVHVQIGHIDYSIEKLVENLQVLLEDLRKLKPSKVNSSSYVKKVSVSSTMGVGIQVSV